MTLNEYLAELSGKRIAVIGLGVSNTPLALLLLGSGCDVTVCDKRDESELGIAAETIKQAGAKLRLGPGYLDNLDHDIVFRTPGLHPFAPQLLEARAGGSVITSETELFFRLCPCRTIGVTGSDGKTTTSTLIAELLRREGHTVHLGGNIGNPLITKLGEISAEDIAVLELSSFQLHSISCRPDIAVITNVSPNHLDVHPDYDDYIRAKSMIFQNQTPADTLILNFDDPQSADFAAAARSRIKYFRRNEPVENGVFLKDGAIMRASGGKTEKILDEKGILLPGLHNRENFMAAFAATDSLVGNESCRAVAATFAGVAHRLEIIAKTNGVTFINDSIATSPTRTIAGLRSFEKPPILIAGGYDKNIPFNLLGDEIAKSAKALFLTGDTARKIKNSVVSSEFYDPAALPVTVLESFEDAVLAASNAAGEGDTVLLSPACASYDMFENFELRGEAFKKIVLGLEQL